jgi:hypothetical protein
MPLNKRSDFQRLMAEIAGSKLDALGFQEVLLKDCMHPEILFNRDRIWFGASWDYRDQYLEVELGHLYWFKDVMPRVIVLGDYGSYVSELKKLKQDEPHFLSKVAETIRDTFDSALRTYEARYDDVLAVRKNPQNLKYRKEFYMHLGPEVSKNDLSKYAA